MNDGRPPRDAWPDPLAAEPAASFPEAWEHFVAARTTLGPQPGVRERWHRGRDRFAVWVLRVRKRAVFERMSLVARALDDAIEPVKPGDAHITVFVAGFPCAGEALHDDDVREATLAAQVERLRKLAPGTLALRIGGANAFFTCAMLEVQLPAGSLDGIQCALAAESAEVRFTPFLPHVTVGRFVDSRPVTPLVQRLEPLRRLEPIVIRPNALDLVEIDAKHEGHAALVTRRVVALT